jgi:predicted acyl esterase
LGKTWNTLSLEHEKKIKPGEVARLRVQLWPTGIVYEAGEQLVLEVNGRQMGLPTLPELPEPTSANKGNHVLDIGGLHEAYLEFSTI